MISPSQQKERKETIMRKEKRERKRRRVHFFWRPLLRGSGSAGAAFLRPEEEDKEEEDEEDCEDRVDRVDRTEEAEEGAAVFLDTTSGFFGPFFVASALDGGFDLDATPFVFEVGVLLVSFPFPFPFPFPFAAGFAFGFALGVVFDRDPLFDDPFPPLEDFSLPSSSSISSSSSSS